MRFTAKLLLIFLLIPLILLGLVAGTAKFELLRPGFWLTTFEKYNVYQVTAAAFKKQAEDQITNGGGNRNDSRILTDLITPENLKDLAERNITNFLTYANGQKSELLVYLPIKKIPKGLLPKNFANLPEETSLSTLLSKFDIKIINSDQIKSISLIGRGITYFLILDLVISSLFLLFLFLLTSAGSRFISMGVTLIVCGLLIIFSAFGGLNFQSQAALVIPAGSSLPQVIALTVLPSILHEISIGWMYIGIAILGAGVVLLLLKKR